MSVRGVDPPRLFGAVHGRRPGPRVGGPTPNMLNAAAARQAQGTSGSRMAIPDCRVRRLSIEQVKLGYGVYGRS